jgi:hypothetical protein
MILAITFDPQGKLNGALVSVYTGMLHDVDALTDMSQFILS